jgi:hypothetical protein
MRSITLILVAEGLFLRALCAQGADPAVVREVVLVRDEVTSSLQALQHYTWTERTDVSVDGKPKSSTTFLCHYDGSGELIRKPVSDNSQKPANQFSNRPVVRKRADLEDYIDRAVASMRDYLPLKPDRIQYMLEHKQVAYTQSGQNRGEFHLTSYFQEGDSIVFTCDPVSKAMLQVHVATTLGTPKDPVTMEALFEKLPDGTNHLANATLNAPRRKVQVKRTNFSYAKSAN